MKILATLLCLLLAGCATPQVSMPVGVASVMYAQARADYAVAKLLTIQGCASQKLDQTTCELARQIDVRAKVYKETIEASLLNPTQPVDWAQVLKYVEEVSGLLLRLGVLP
jgi:hypothetical protein